MALKRDRRESDEQRKEISVAGYRIGPRLGAGATGTVFSAVHPDKDKEVAVKIVHRHLTEDPQTQEAFLKELSRIAALKHPNIQHLEAVGQFDSGEIFVISAQGQGIPLTDLMAGSGPLPMVEAIPLLDRLAEILGDLHDEGLVHGNLTPENIWLNPSEGTKWPPPIRLLDYGMSMLHRPKRMEDEGRAPYYLSPEQIRGEAPSISTDVYAYGVMAYQMLTGRLPYSSPRLGEVLLMHLNDDPPPPGDIVPMNPETELFLFQALSKDPNYRFKDMHQVRESILVILPLTQKSSAPELAEAVKAEELDAEEDQPRAGEDPDQTADQLEAQIPVLADEHVVAEEVDEDDDGFPVLNVSPIEDGPTPVAPRSYKSLVYDSTTPASKSLVAPADLERDSGATPPAERAVEPDEDAEPDADQLQAVSEDGPTVPIRMEEVEDADIIDELEPTPDPTLGLAEVAARELAATAAAQDDDDDDDDEDTGKWQTGRPDPISMADREEVSGIINPKALGAGQALSQDEDLVIVRQPPQEAADQAPPREQSQPAAVRHPRTTPPPLERPPTTGPHQPQDRPKRPPSGPHAPRKAPPALPAIPAPPEEDFDLEEICFSGPHNKTAEEQDAAAAAPQEYNFYAERMVPILSAFAGIVTAISMGLVGYWLFTGRWPFPLGQ